MGLIGKFIGATIAKSVIKKVGDVALGTTSGVFDRIEKHNKHVEEEKQRQIDREVRRIRKIENELKEANNQNPNSIYANIPDLESLLGTHHSRVRAEFLSLGFSDISLIENIQYCETLPTKNGLTDSIEICGKAKTKANKSFPISSPVIIEYTNYILVPQANRDSEVECNKESTYHFCVNCGNKLNVSDAFCSKCGTKIPKL